MAANKKKQNGKGEIMTELLEKELVYKIVGCAMKVHSGVGHGLREKTY